MDAYDVIIIGTGAGGGTLARHLAPSGKRILLLERGDWLPREPSRTGARAQDGCSVENKYISLPTRGYERDHGKPFPAAGCTTSSAARRSSTARRCTGCGRRTSASSATMTAARRRGPSATTSFEPYLHEGRTPLRGTRRPRRGPDRGTRRAAQYPSPGGVSMTARIQQLHDDLRGRRLPPVRTRLAVWMPTERGRHMPYTVCVRCQNCRRLPMRGCTARSDARGAGRARRAQALGCRAHHQRQRRSSSRDEHEAGTAVRPESSSSTTAPPSAYSADIVAVACGAANTAALLLSSANDKHPNGLANGSDQVGRNYMFHASEAVLALTRGEPDRLPEDARPERLLLRQRRASDYPLGQHPDGAAQVAGAEVFHGREADRGTGMLAPHWSLEIIAKHAIDFWLSDRGLAACPRTG